MEGWIKVHRKLADSPQYFAETFCRNMAWIDLLILANHDTGYFRCRGIKIEVKRGQVGTGLEALAARWKWSRGKVERFLCELETVKQIVRQKNNTTTLISIVNYHEYQQDGKANSKANGQQTVKQTDINKNDKNKTTKVVLGPPPEIENFTDEQKDEFGEFQDWILKECPIVSQMKEPLKIDQYFKLVERFGKIGYMLKKMHNYNDLLKKNRSTYLTLINWMEKDLPVNGTPKIAAQVKPIHELLAERAKKHGF